MLDGESFFSLALFLISVGLFWRTFSFETMAGYEVLGPGWWPRLLLAAMAVLSAGLFVGRLRWLRRGGERQEETVATGRLLGLTAACFGYAVLMPYLGFLVSTPLFLLAVLLLFGTPRGRVLALLPLGITVLLLVIFVKVLYISLPRGVGPFLYFSRLFY